MAGNRIGLFGGTFNPIHLGHLQAARTVMERLSLMSLLFIPAAIPPHKSMGGIADAADRLEMIRLAVLNEPCFSVSDVEINRSGPSYTVDTVHYFLNGALADDRYYLIVGLDAFLEMDTWKSYKNLLKIIPLVVMARPESVPDLNVSKTIEAFLSAKVSGEVKFEAATDRFECQGYQPVTLLRGGFRMLSATLIRDRIRAGESIDTLVPASVGAFIRRKGLYR